MMKSKKENNTVQWGWIFVGAMFSYFGAHTILTGEPGLRGGVEIPVWTGWVQLPFGLWILFLAIRTLIRNRHTREPVVDLDEEAVRAEAEMDAMYLSEHGKLPDKPKKDE